jgi:hypothetical protein
MSPLNRAGTFDRTQDLVHGGNNVNQHGQQLLTYTV